MRPAPNGRPHQIEGAFRSVRRFSERLPFAFTLPLIVRHRDGYGAGRAVLEGKKPRAMQSPHLQLRVGRASRTLLQAGVGRSLYVKDEMRAVLVR